MKLGDYTLRRAPHIIVAVFANVDMRLGTIERNHIARVLAAVDGNLSAAARMLGMHRRTLQRKLRRK